MSSTPTSSPLAPSAASTAALVFDAVSVTGWDPRLDRPTTLLHALDWRVAPGEHWVLLGANGAGKTTMLKTAGGSIEPADGTVTVLGDRHGAPAFRDPRLRMSMIDATPRRFSSAMTATDVVLLRAAGSIALRGQRIPPEEVERAAELLQRFGCGDLARRKYADCSQGEQQRILLARALMRDPSLVLFDEPTTGLDLPGREGFLQAMARLASERPQLATVTVTHHVEELPPSTTHAYMLRGGRTVAAGPVDDVLTEELLSACFGVPVSLGRFADRWVARAQAPGW
jgi:iron complex transport system ATP-binding protein